jgi:hypothetical protein
MRRSPLVPALAATALAALWSFVASSQSIDPSPCEDTCREEESICVEACSEHSDPMECEQVCHEEREDCVHECRQ